MGDASLNHMAKDEQTLEMLVQHNATHRSHREMPVAFISHGAGPCFFIDGFWRSRTDPGIGIGSPTANFLSSVAEAFPTPRAILCVSAHWESCEEYLTVSSSLNPQMIFDYGGFPEHTYNLNYPAPGSPDLADRVAALLQAGDVPCRAQDRGFDHGAFVPLLLMYPNADIPVVQLSIHGSYDGEFHLRIGELLRPLKAEGVLIMGSGSASHSTRDPAKVPEWHQWLTETLCELPADQRRSRLSGYRNYKICTAAHPRPDHLMPLLVAVGAAGDAAGYKVHTRPAALDLSSFVFSQVTEPETNKNK